MAEVEETTTTPHGVADQRREEMLRAALEVIAERGFPETRIADVAEQAGSSPALVIYYFKTKENLLTKAIRHAEVEWSDLGARRMEVIESASARLEDIVAMTCLPETDTDLRDSRTLWLDVWAQSVRHPEMARVREEFDAHRRETIVGIVRDGKASGEFVDVDPTEFSVTLSALLDGLTVQIALHDPVVDPQRAFRDGMRFASQALGFKWKPKKGPRSGSKGKKSKK
jgi:AcrR family transcriptional regulator